MTCIGFVEFDERDVVRHPLVQKIIVAYAEDTEAKRLARQASEALDGTETAAAVAEEIEAAAYSAGAGGGREPDND